MLSPEMIISAIREKTALVFSFGNWLTNAEPIEQILPEILIFFIIRMLESF